MIVKSLRHKVPQAKYSVNYVFDGMPEEWENRWIIFRNITSGFDRDSIVKAFDQNAGFISPTLKRQKTYRYHEILAFSHINNQDLTREKLHAIASMYLQLRDPEQSSIIICVPHLDKHYHLHLIISSNAIGSNRSGDRMMDNQTYYSLRRDIERWTLQNYPELHHSTVYLPEKEIHDLLPEKYRNERKAKELIKGKSKRTTVKDQLAQKITSIMEESTSLNDFQEKINQLDGIQTYSRRGKLTGIILENKTKFRFKNLGIDLLEENFEVLKRMAELETIKEKDSEKVLER